MPRNIRVPLAVLVTAAITPTSLASHAPITADVAIPSTLFPAPDSDTGFTDRAALAADHAGLEAPRERPAIPAAFTLDGTLLVDTDPDATPFPPDAGGRTHPAITFIPGPGAVTLILLSGLSATRRRR